MLGTWAVCQEEAWLVSWPFLGQSGAISISSVKFIWDLSYPGSDRTLQEPPEARGSPSWGSLALFLLPRTLGEPGVYEDPQQLAADPLPGPVSGRWEDGSVQLREGKGEDSSAENPGPQPQP